MQDLKGERAQNIGELWEISKYYTLKCKAEYEIK